VCESNKITKRGSIRAYGVKKFHVTHQHPARFSGAYLGVSPDFSRYTESLPYRDVTDTYVHVDKSLTGKNANSEVRAEALFSLEYEEVDGSHFFPYPNI